MAPAALAGVIGLYSLPVSENSSVEPYFYREITEVRPKSNLAIVLDLLKNKNVPNEKYIDALLDVVEDKKITHISRISRYRLCVYFTTARKAAELVEVNKYLTVKGEEVEINFLIAKSVRVIISNADASISNTAMKRYLKEVCSIKTASSVPKLKVNSVSDRLKNVFSFRRLVYIHPEDVNKLPSSQKVKGDRATRNVFLNTGNPIPFVCGSEDHFAKQCTEADPTQALSSKSGESSNTINDDGFTLVGSGKNEKTAEKRDGKSAAKKPRKESTNIPEQIRASACSQLESARAQIEASSSTHTLSFDDVVILMVSTFGVNADKKRKNAMTINESKNKPEAIKLLRTIHCVVGSIGMNNKITRLANALDGNNFLTEHETSDDDSSGVVQTSILTN